MTDFTGMANDSRLAWLCRFVSVLAVASAPAAGGAWAAGVTADRVLGQPGFTSSEVNLLDARGVYRPSGVAVDRSAVPNRLYVADTENNRVLAWADVDAFATGDPADLVIGEPAPVFSCDGASPTRLCRPAGIAVDGAGNLYVADTRNSRVLEFDAPFAYDAAADRVFGQKGSFTTGACNVDGKTATSLCFPVGVAVDGAGNLYVADTNNNRIVEYDAPLASDAAGDRIFGQGVCAQGPGGLCYPAGVAVDGAGNLYVADTDNHRIVEYDTPLAGDAAADRAFDVLGYPRGVAVDGAGNLYVADTDNHRILAYETPLATDTVADRVFGQGGSFTSDACNLGGVSASSLCWPLGLAVNAAGDLYVADRDNHRVLQYDTPLTSDVAADRVFGQAGPSYNAPNLADARGMFGPRGVAVDRSVTPNRLYVADAGNHRVLAWANVTAFTAGDPADLVIGQPDFLSTGCNTGGTTATSLCTPGGIAVDGAGNLYVADGGNHRVLAYGSPFADDAVADRVFGQGGAFTAGTPNAGGVSATSLFSPFGVAVDGAGNLYVADTENHRVLEYDTPLAGDTIADQVFGQLGSFTTRTFNAGGLSATSLRSPLGVAIDGAGNLYVADTGNHRVLEYDTPLAGDTTADRVFGQWGLFGSAQCAFFDTSAQSLCRPDGVAVDGAGNLYVSDEGRVVEYDTPLASGVAADRVFGQEGNLRGASCNLGGASAASLCNPGGVGVDGAGTLYVADRSNNRVLVYEAPLSAIRGACTDGTPAASCPLCTSCTPTGDCAIGPRTGCTMPTRPRAAQLLMKDFLINDNDRMQFKWTKGGATTPAELGNPLASDDVALCLYTGTGGVARTTVRANDARVSIDRCGTKPCWVQLGRSTPKGFKFRNTFGNGQGVRRVTLKAGPAGRASISLASKGQNVYPVSPLALPLTAQFHADNGHCWEATFSTATVNTYNEFKARSD